VHFTILFPRLLLRQPHSPNVWVRKYSRGNIGVVRLARFATKKGVGQAMTLGKGNRCQLHAVDDVPDGVDAGRRRPEFGFDSVSLLQAP
jgi:hypothetical protein